MPDGRTLLERETVRVIELRERLSPVSAEQARDIVWRLFGETVLGSGEQAVSRRRLDRERVAEIVGVPLSVVDDAEPWSDAVETSYRETLSARRPDAAWTLLDLTAAERPAALSFVVPRESRGSSQTQAQPATSLLNRDDDILLQGPAGAGKTTTLAQLRAEALERKLLPLELRVGTYVAGTLEHLLRRSVERSIGRPLAPSVIAQLLSRSDVIVLLDGAGELVPEQRQAMMDDLAPLREQYPDARFLLAAREAAPFGASALSWFALEGLDADTRREIATSLTAGGDEIVEEIERRLGDVVDNPLLFTMAVGLFARGTRAGTRAELFDGFVDGLQHRDEGAVLSAAARAVLEAAAFDLREEGRYSAERWWWLERFTDSRRNLIDTGMFDAGTLVAEKLLGELESVGLIQSFADGDLALLHDLFCDWLAAEAVRHNLRELPDPVIDSLEEVAVFLAERGALDSDRLLAVAGNAVTAARAADAHPAVPLDSDLADAIWQRLRDQLAPAVRASLEGHRLRVIDGQPAWICLDQGTTTDPADLARFSPIVCIAQGAVSPLSAAVDLWLAVLRLAIRDAVPDPPTRPPRDDEDLAQLLEDAVIQRTAAIEALADDLVPSLLPRIYRTTGPSGLRGWLLPAQSFQGIPGSGDTIEEHLLHYIPTAEGARVDRVNKKTDIPDAARATVMSAETYLRETPAAAARKTVSDALAKLIPRYSA